MRLLILTTLAISLAAPGALPQQPTASPPQGPAAYAGFDRNIYPGDAALPELRKHFAFVGYWLTNPPGETRNTWVGKRDVLLSQGFGFVIVANGRLDKEIVRAGKQGKPPATLAREDASKAVAAAGREGFPPGAILFLDQEEGGRLLPRQAAYLLGWTEAVAASSYRPGVYASGKPVPDGNGPDGKPVTITTIQDIRAQVAAKHLHEVAMWVIQDACPPAPGCVIQPAPPTDLSGTLDAIAWQYAQSPREKSITQACGKTYAAINCETPAPAHLDVDLSSASTPDPSHGR
jgi:hypothetical protein